MRSESVESHAVLTTPAADADKSLQSCPTLCDPIDGSPPGSPVPGILQARTRVGCHFLLQCMKVKSESEVAQSCPTLSDLMDFSLSGSSVHGIIQAGVLEWVPLPSPLLTPTCCLSEHFRELRLLIVFNFKIKIL